MSVRMWVKKPRSIWIWEGLRCLVKPTDITGARPCEIRVRYRRRLAFMFNNTREIALRYGRVCSLTFQDFRGGKKKRGCARAARAHARGYAHVHANARARAR